jgi:hypothetical protein
MSPESDPTLSAIQRVTSTFGGEAVPAAHAHQEYQEQRIDHDEAKQLADFLGEQGCYLLTELPQGISGAEHDQLQRAREAVEQNIRSSDEVPARILSRSVHYFEVAAAPTADDARALLDKYDYLHPHESPEDRTARKQSLMNRWADVQTLRQHAAEDRALAPEVAGVECQLPAGYAVRSIQHFVAGVPYDNLEAVLGDLTNYRDAVMVDPPDSAVAGGPDEIQYGEFHSYPRMQGGVMLSSYDTRQQFGVSPMERFAHIAGRQAGHSTNFTLGFRRPSPQTTGEHTDAHAQSDLAAQEVLQVLANVTGLQQIGQAQRTDEGLTYALPNGGRIDIVDQAASRAGRSRYDRQEAEATSGFKVTIQLGGSTSNDELDKASKRLSAWMSLQAAQSGQKPGLPTV